MRWVTWFFFGCHWSDYCVLEFMLGDCPCSHQDLIPMDISPVSSGWAGELGASWYTPLHSTHIWSLSHIPCWSFRLVVRLGGYHDKFLAFLPLVSVGFQDLMAASNSNLRRSGWQMKSFGRLTTSLPFFCFFGWGVECSYWLKKGERVQYNDRCRAPS